MKQYAILGLIVLGTSLCGCNWWGIGTVTGNGNIITENRSVAGFSEVSVGGPFDVVIRQGEGYSVSIETDENLMEYVNFDKDGRKLKIKIRSGVNIRSKQGIQIKISMPEIKALSFAGSGKMKSDGMIRSTDPLKLSVAGSGDIEADLQCPEVKASIAGSGTIKVQGQTRDVDLSIAGSGDFRAEDLLSEKTKISIAGSGSAYVFASTDLNISIAGSGDVYYKGNPPNLKKSIAGSGNVKPLQ